MEKRVISGKYSGRDWDYETVKRLSGDYEDWDKLTDWFLKAGRMFLTILLVLLAIAVLALAGYAVYRFYKAESYEGIVAIAVIVCIFIAYIRSDRKKSL